MDVSQTLYDRAVHVFRDSPHYNALLVLLSDALQDCDDVISFLLGSKSIDTAEGEQLDILGELIGVERPLAQEDMDNMFTVYQLGDSSDPGNKTGFYDDTTGSGGYLSTYDGIESVTDPGSYMSDEDMRFFIRQKAASYRKKMTRENLWDYLIAFGANCKIDDDTLRQVEIDPYNYYDLNDWQKRYVETRGFKPAGISVKFVDNLSHGVMT